MGQSIEIPVAAGNVGGWLARPAVAARGAIVVVQEIFGVNGHMREVAEGYARDGFVALAPALFDAVERAVELDYDEAGFARGRELAGRVGIDGAVAIVDAAAQWLRNDGLAVAVVGFCWGGTIAYLANTRLGLPAVSYYGARTVPFLDEPLRAPMMFHFGEHDPSIPAGDIAAHARAQPGAMLHVYPAGHGFNRSVDAAHHDPDSARLAHRRTLAFLAQALGGGDMNADPGARP